MSDDQNAVTETPKGDAIGDKAAGDSANLVYILYLVAVLLGITALVGLIMAYVQKGSAPAWLQTHYQFQIRTFWIGLLYSAIGWLTTFIIIGFVILLFALVWWIVRCVKGMQAVGRGEAHPNPTSWMFG
jgi:uncharacterized membrane protein